MLLEASSPVTLCDSGYLMLPIKAGAPALAFAGSEEYLPLQLERLDVSLVAISNSRTHRRLSPHWTPTE